MRGNKNFTCFVPCKKVFDTNMKQIKVIFISHFVNVFQVSEEGKISTNIDTKILSFEEFFSNSFVLIYRFFEEIQIQDPKPVTGSKTLLGDFTSIMAKFNLFIRICHMLGFYRIFLACTNSLGFKKGSTEVLFQGST